MYAFRNSGLTKEQLNNLGVTGKDVPIAAATTLFPPLISRPMEIEKTKALDYKVMWKEEFKIHLYDVHSKSELNLTDDSYSSKVANALEKEHKKKLQFKFAWNQMPSELRPASKRKSPIKQPNRVKRLKAMPTEIVEQKMKILEQKEKEHREGDERSVKGDNESDEDLDNDEEERMEDHEMDEDLDYGNNYFDNGEDDEDDNLDEGDGPVY